MLVHTMSPAWRRRWPLPVILLLITCVADVLQPVARGDQAPDRGLGYSDYLRAQILAEKGSRPEALRVLTESLRVSVRSPRGARCP